VHQPLAPTVAARRRHASAQTRLCGSPLISLPCVYLEQKKRADQENQGNGGRIGQDRPHDSSCHACPLPGCSAIQASWCACALYTRHATRAHAQEPFEPEAFEAEASQPSQPLPYRSNLIRACTCGAGAALSSFTFKQFGGVKKKVSSATPESAAAAKVCCPLHLIVPS
jgi:hypothetical protein